MPEILQGRSADAGRRERERSAFRKYRDFPGIVWTQASERLRMGKWCPTDDKHGHSYYWEISVARG